MARIPCPAGCDHGQVAQTCSTCNGDGQISSWDDQGNEVQKPCPSNCSWGIVWTPCSTCHGAGGIEVPDPPGSGR